MSKQRLMIWLGLLALVLGIRWWDPLGKPKVIQAESAAVVREAHLAASSPNGAAPPELSFALKWPARETTQEKDITNAFASRTELVQLELKRQKAAATPPPPPVFVGPPLPPPPPPPPVENPPPLQVIGTWGGGEQLSVFIAAPHGTVLAHSGDVLMAQYRVQSITKSQVTLLQNSNQRIWNLAIPAAPAAQPPWPSR